VAGMTVPAAIPARIAGKEMPGCTQTSSVRNSSPGTHTERVPCIPGSPWSPPDGASPCPPRRTVDRRDHHRPAVRISGPRDERVQFRELVLPAGKARHVVGKLSRPRPAGGPNGRLPGRVRGGRSGPHRCGRRDERRVAAEDLLVQALQLRQVRCPAHHPVSNGPRESRRARQSADCSGTAPALAGCAALPARDAP
jgi:hypothetical protein